MVRSKQDCGRAWRRRRSETLPALNRKQFVLYLYELRQTAFHQVHPVVYRRIGGGNVQGFPCLAIFRTVCDIVHVWPPQATDNISYAGMIIHGTILQDEMVCEPPVRTIGTNREPSGGKSPNFPVQTGVFGPEECATFRPCNVSPK